MALIEINFNPPKRHVVIFGVLLLVFFGLVGLLAMTKPHALIVAACILGSAWLVSLVFNTENRPRQLCGLLLPVIFGASGGLVVLDVPALNVTYVTWGVGLLACVLICGWPTGGRRAYVVWMMAGAPIGWALSHVLLATIYYLVLTPVGLIMRIVGYDPMHRKFDSTTATYWIKHEPVQDVGRYFRQY